MELVMKWESIASAAPVLPSTLDCSVVTEIYAPLVHVRMVEHVQCEEMIMCVVVRQCSQAESVEQLFLLPVIQPPARMAELVWMV